MWKYESVKFITCSFFSLLTEESNGGPFSFEVHLQIVWHSNKQGSTGCNDISNSFFHVILSLRLMDYNELLNGGRKNISSTCSVNIFQRSEFFFFGAYPSLSLISVSASYGNVQQCFTSVLQESSI